MSRAAYEKAKEEIEQMLYGDGPRVLPKRTDGFMSMKDALKFWWAEFSKRYEEGLSNENP
jgi:hypothetical protein